MSELDEKQILSQALNDLELSKEVVSHGIRLEYLLRSIAGSLLVLAKIVSDVELGEEG